MWPISAGKSCFVLGAVLHNAVSVWYQVPELNECFIALWCINDTHSSWLVETSGGLNN